MKIKFNGATKEFSQVLADWLVRDAKYWDRKQDGFEGQLNSVRLQELNNILGNRGPEHLLELLQLMVNNCLQFEAMIAFAIRYRSATKKATVQDMQQALDLIKILEVHNI